MRKFFRAPPAPRDDFFELFHVIWDQGIGNTALPDGLCGEKWTVDSLIAAFENAGASISDRSIEEWRRGKFVPGPQNLRVLLAIVSDTRTRPAWRDTLLTSARRTRERRKLEEEANAPQNQKAPASGSGQPDTSPAAAPPATAISGYLSRHKRWLWAPLAGLAAVMIAAGASWAIQPRISDIRICDAENFSVVSQRCGRHMDQLPADAKRVYVSFEVLNHPQTEPFTRTWFLNGMKILEREGLLAPPWEGWTWYGNANPDAPGAVPVDNGNYTFRVSAGPAVASVSFFVGPSRRLAAGQRFSDTFVSGSGQGPGMVVVPPGHFVKGSPDDEPGRMSDEGPRHSVSINYSWSVSTHEITWNEWMQCVDDGGCNSYVPEGRDPSYGNHPVVNVSYNDVFAYTHWLNRRLGIAQERFDRYTLLSESEWEYAALAEKQGSGSGPIGSEPAISPAQAHFRSAGGQPTSSQEAGSFAPNAWGLHDMRGNVAELVEDCYRPEHSREINDGSAYLEAACTMRVAKGGSFADGADSLRVAARRPARAEDRQPDVGFRLARRLEPRTVK